MARRLRAQAGRGEAPLPRRGCQGRVHSLTRPGGSRAPRAEAASTTTDSDRPLRRLGTRRPLVARPHGPHQPRRIVERMALIWHDWFATGDVGSQQLSHRAGAAVPRRRASARFDDLLRAVDDRPGDAGLALRHRQHQVRAERELRPRADGALHARRQRRLGLSVLRGRRPRAGPGADRLARDWDDDVGPPTSASTRSCHDKGRRRSSARPATSTGRTPAGSSSTTRAHAPYFVNRLWTYFIPTDALGLDRSTA